MRIVSLFAGIGGLEMGLEVAGVGHTIAQVEIDPHCQRVLARHWPSVLRYPDVRLVQRSIPLASGGCAIQCELPAFDLLCAGFPCQDISTAGKGAGLDGERSGLWWEVVRIIRETRPRFVVLENVAALVVRGLDVVLGALAQLGYNAEWSVLSAASVGAPHLRRRVFVIAWLPNADLRRYVDPFEPRERRSGMGEKQSAGSLSPTALPNASGEHSRRQPQPERRGRNPTEPARDGAVGAVADGDGERLQEQRKPEPGREQGARRGKPDGRGEVWEQQHAPEMADGDGLRCQVSEDARARTAQPDGRSQAAHLADGDKAGREQQRGPKPRATQLATAQRSSGWSPQSRMGGAFTRFPAWSYRGTDPEAWEQGVARTVAPRTVPDRVARLKCLGNAVVPQCAYEIGLRVLAIQGRVGP